MIPKPDQEAADELVEQLSDTFAFTEKQAVALVYHGMYGISHDDLARSIGSSEKSVKQTFHTAKQKAHDILDVASLVDGMNTREISTDLGGAVAQILRQWEGQMFRCSGCSSVHKITKQTRIDGEYHSGGLEDAQGRKWWVSVPCPVEGETYSNSWTTVQKGLLGTPQQYVATIDLVEEEGVTYLAFRVTENDNTEALAEARYRLYPTDHDDSEMFRITEGADGWRQTHDSIVVHEFEQEQTLRFSGEPSPPETYPFEAVPPRDERELKASITLDWTEQMFTFEVDGRYNTWVSARRAWQDLGLRTESIELELEGETDG